MDLKKKFPVREQWKKKEQKKKDGIIWNFTWLKEKTSNKISKWFNV